MPPRDNSQTHTDGAAEHQEPSSTAPLNCDYLVVGAGTSGMAFIDTILTENPNATIVLVDRNKGPGGHWQHVYPFCKLHQASCNYGVNSLAMGKSIDRKGRERYDVHDRATGAEVVEYYETALAKFQDTQRFRAFFEAEYEALDEAQNVHVVRVPKTGDSISVKCRKLVMIRNKVEVPSMRKPTIPVHETAHFVPVNDVPSSVQSGNYKNYVVFGCGKTGADAIVCLLRSGVDPSLITWIVPRDVWYFLRDGLADFWKSNVLIMPPMLKESSVKDVFLAWETNGITGRLHNPAHQKSGDIPKIFKGPTMDLEELALMQSIKNVVRMGRATSVEATTIVLEKGTLEYTPEDTLLIDCMVDGIYGYNFDKDFKIFEPNQINLGPITFVFNASASGAHIAFLECALQDDASKNDCCFFIKGMTNDRISDIQNMIGQFYLQDKTTQKLMKVVPGGAKFFFESRTNLLKPTHHKGGMCRFLWFSFGPQRGAAFSKKLTKKIEAKGFTDLDHCFGVTV